MGPALKFNEFTGITLIQHALSELPVRPYRDRCIFGPLEDDGGRNICMSPSGNIYVTGDTDSDDFPITPNAFCTTIYGYTVDIYISCLTPDLSTLVYSTFIGGINSERPKAILCDESGKSLV